PRTDALKVTGSGYAAHPSQVLSNVGSGHNNQEEAEPESWNVIIRIKNRNQIRMSVNLVMNSDPTLLFGSVANNEFYMGWDGLDDNPASAARMNANGSVYAYLRYSADIGDENANAVARGLMLSLGIDVPSLVTGRNLFYNGSVRYDDTDNPQ